MLTERAKCFLDAYDMYLYRAQEMVNDMATHLTEKNIDKYPPVFYINEGSGQGIHYLIHIGYDNGCYIYADILLDVENYDYFYDLRSVDLFVITPSGMSEDASLMNDLASSRDGYTMVAASEAVYYSYAAEEKVYIWWDAAHGTCGYLFEEPTAEDFPGRVLHRAQYDANGSFRGEVHTFESSVDAAGRELLHCVDCHLKLRG